MRNSSLLTVCLTLVFLSSAIPAQDLLPLHLEESAGVSRRGWPVRGGVPFARGRLREATHLRLLTSEGAAVECQARTLCRWPDGSVKWALFDFQADLPADTTTVWRLALDGGRTPAGVLAEQTEDAVRVRTGTCEIVVPQPAGLPGLPLFSLRRINPGTSGGDIRGDAFLRLQSTPPGPPQQENWLRDAADEPGTLFRAGLDLKRTVRIEENGPLRAIVRIDGWHVSEYGRRAFPFTLRLHAFRGASRILFQHTFVASEDVRTNFLREMGVTLESSTRPTTCAFGAVGQGTTDAWQCNLEPGTAAAVAAVGAPHLYHLVSFRDRHPALGRIETRANGDWSPVATDLDVPGWAVMAGDKFALTAAFRDFRRLHPKELRVDGDGRLTVYLWADRGGKCLDLRRRSQDLDAGYMENGMDPHGGRGIAKTHEWMIDYSADSAAVAQARAAGIARCLDEPVFPYVTPEYAAATGAFGEFKPHDPDTFPRLEAAIAFGFRYMRALRVAFAMDGMIDWGDVAIAGVGQADHKGAMAAEGIPWRGYTGWCNSDFSLAHGFFLHYLRTGDRRVLLDGEAMALHVGDIDTNHYSPEDPTLIGMGHRHDQQHWGNGLREYCYAPNALIDLYLLTGNRRAFDVAREMADHFVAVGGSYGRYMTLRFWELTGDEKYRSHAEETLARDLGERDRDGWPFAIGANFRSKSYDGVGYTFYDSILPNDRLSRSFVRCLDFLRERYTVCWKTKGHPDHCVFALGHKAAPTPANTEMLKIAVWLAAAGMPEDPAAFAARVDAPFEQLLQINTDTISLGRTDVFGLYYLVGLPRVMARLEAVGVQEDEAVDYAWEWTDVESFEETLDNSKVRPQGKSWHYSTTHQSPSYRPDDRLPAELQERWRAATARHALYEDDRELGPHPFSAAQQIRDGRKGWTRRLSDAIQFTTPDNSDPRTNGRTYKLVYTSEEDARANVPDVQPRTRERN